MERLILSIDGGGSKLYYFAEMMFQLEARLNRPLREVFDLIVGTSAGGIMALALAAGVPAWDVRELVSDHLGDVFKRSWWQKASNPGGVRAPLYGAKPLREILEEVFGGRTMGSLTTPAVVTALEVPAEARTWGRAKWATQIVQTFMDSGQDAVRHQMGVLSAQHPSVTQVRTPHTPDGTAFIKSWDPYWKGVTLVDAALATSAAPTYFPAHPIDDMMFVDGGVYANNPAMCALVDAMTLWPHGEYTVCSLGCPGLGLSMDDASDKALDAMRWYAQSHASQRWLDDVERAIFA